jgi:anthranilate synthase component 2
MCRMMDNDDRFTFSLMLRFFERGQEVKVFHHDEITLDEIAALKPDRLVLSSSRRSLVCRASSP